MNTKRIKLTNEQKKINAAIACKKWREANRHKTRECSRLWYEKNKDERNRKRREKYAAKAINGN